MGVLHMPTPAGHHPLKSCPRHEAPPQIILKSVTFTMTTGSPPRAPPLRPPLQATCNVHVVCRVPCAGGPAPGLVQKVGAQPTLDRSRPNGFFLTAVYRGRALFLLVRLSIARATQEARHREIRFLPRRLPYASICVHDRAYTIRLPPLGRRVHGEFCLNEVRGSL
jgi:hypothetical protein